MTNQESAYSDVEPGDPSVERRRAANRRVAALRSVLLGLTAAASLGAPARGQLVHVGEASGQPGATVEFRVSFVGQGSGASALKVDLGFEPSASIVDDNAHPDCAVAPDIGKESTSFAFLPSACAPGVDCVQVRAAVISFIGERNSEPIPDGVVFTCRFTIPASARVGDTFEVRIDSASAVFADGEEIDATTASSGALIRAVETTPCKCDFGEDGKFSLAEVQKAFKGYLQGCDP